MSHRFLGMRSFVQTTSVSSRLSIVSQEQDSHTPPPPISYTGAAVSCLKLAVKFWTHQSFESHC